MCGMPKNGRRLAKMNPNLSLVKQVPRKKMAEGMSIKKKSKALRESRKRSWDERARAIGRVLVINVGSTSTKLGIYLGKDKISESVLKFSPRKKYKSVIDELEQRREQVERFFNHVGLNVAELACVMARGGLLAPLPAGVYRINDKMLEDLRTCRYGEHPSNLSALIASELVEGTKIPTLIADPVVVDEFEPYARVSGVAGIERASRQHTLNIRAVCRRACQDLGIPLSRLKAVCVHLGSGFSVVTVKNGKLVDNADGLLGEGPFSVERAGVLPLRKLLDLYDRLKDRKKVEHLLSKRSGLAGYLGTNDFEEIEARVLYGDEKASFYCSAMVYQIAKNIAMYAAPLKGRQQAVIITGALAHSEWLVKEIRKYVRWVAPRFLVYPGEDEMSALRDMAYAALLGKERIKEYKG